jgi:hypothetical protein
MSSYMEYARVTMVLRPGVYQVKNNNGTRQTLEEKDLQSCHPSNVKATLP